MAGSGNWGVPPMSELVQRQNVSDMVAARIKDYIIENELGPGDRLPTEHELAERFGVSRISVREATKALGFLGIIDAAPRRGLTIAELNMERVSQYLGFHFAVSDYPYDQLIETRVAIELGGLRRLIGRMEKDPSIYQRLRATNDHLQSIVEQEELDEWIEHDVAFHRELIKGSGLEPLMAFHDLLLVFFRKVRPGLSLEVRRFSIHGHQVIIDSLRDGNLEAARDCLREHIERHRSRF